jgi:hypothetical protein
LVDLGSLVKTLNWAIWAALAVAVVGSELAGRLRLAGLASLERLLGRGRATVVGRAAMVILWAWLGWHVFAR